MTIGEEDTKKVLFQPGVVIKRTGPKIYEKSIPFEVRLRIIAVRNDHRADIQFDPRLDFSISGERTISAFLEDYLYTSIDIESLHGLACKIVNKLQDIYTNKELEVYENSHHPPYLISPFWEHDCDECILLGQVNEVDLYFCRQNFLGRPTLIARHGSDGPSYMSGVSFASHSPELWAAAVFAEARGLGKFLDSRHTIVLDDKVI